MCLAENWLSAVSALTHAHQIEAASPELHAAIIRLKQTSEFKDDFLQDYC
jgi:hypothetical protein